MRAAKVQASLRIRAVSPEPSLLAHTSSESRGTFRQKARSLAPLNGWACAVKICHDGMLEDTNSLDAAQLCKNKAPSYSHQQCAAYILCIFYASIGTDIYMRLEKSDKLDGKAQICSPYKLSPVKRKCVFGIYFVYILCKHWNRHLYATREIWQVGW